MSHGPNRFNNNELLHHNAGLHSVNHGEQSVALGTWSRDSKKDSLLIPIAAVLRNLLDSSPYTFRVQSAFELPAPLAGVGLRYPCVLYDRDKFGQPVYDPKIHARRNKAWRMYVQETTTFNMYFTESDDGITWDTPQLLDAAIFPPTPNHALQGVQVFYNSAGIVTVSGVSYPFAAIWRDAAKTTADATDMWLSYSLDGITWLRVAMANHDVTGNPYGNELAASLGTGAAFLDAVDPSVGAYDATLVRTLRNADGDWWSLQRYQTAPGLAGDTVFGSTIMAMDSTDAADYLEMGFFANWNRNNIRQIGERSFGQGTKAVLFHVGKFKEYYLGLVQLWFHVGGAATLIPCGLALALSKDGLHFDVMGPLYDAGLTHMLNDRTGVVDQVDMTSNAYLRNQGDGDGSAIYAGSIVTDQSGRAFEANGGRLRNAREFLRVYWTEEDSGKILWGCL